MNSPNKIWSSLWDNYKSIPAQQILNEPAGMTQRSEFVGLLLESFNLKGMTILEVGTGTGQYCIELALRGAHCTGIDIDPGSIKLANRLSKEYGIDNCVFENIDLFDLHDKQYDIVFSMGTLEHFQDKEIVRMLKKMNELGDYVITGVPFSGSSAYTMSKNLSQKMGTWEYGEEKDFETMTPLFQKARMNINRERVIGLCSEAYYLKRVNANLIPAQIATNLESKFKDKEKDIGSWLIDIGSQSKLIIVEPIQEGVSIIVPIYNGAKFIRRLVDNLYSKVNYPNFEIIFVNDCSTDNTKVLLEEIVDYGHILNLKKNVGEIGARLAGLEKAKYDYVYFIDVDDLVFPDNLKQLMRDLKSCPKGTYLPNSSAQMDNGSFSGDIWLHEFLPTPKDYIRSELANLCGKISLGNTIMKKEWILRAYDTYHEILKKVGKKRMNVAGDSILCNIMVFNGDITSIIPVYYTYRGYEHHLDSASQNIADRVSDISLMLAYCFTRMDEGTEMVKMISQKAMLIYGKKMGAEFMRNFYHYKEVLNAGE